MVNLPEHIVKSFDDQLKQLGNILVEMGALVESQLQQAVEALASHDLKQAKAVVEQDQKIDSRDQMVSNLVVKILALRQPMAQDLREVVSSLRISSDLERMGDYAANVAKRVPALPETMMNGQFMTGIARMGKAVQQIVKNVLDAYINKNIDQALQAWRQDEEVDALYTSVFRELLTYMMEDVRTISGCIHLLFIAKNIERIGDHATNIAETIYFMVHGSPLKGDRPKSDHTITNSYLTPPPSTLPKKESSK